MVIAVLADDEQWEELLQSSMQVDYIRVNTIEQLLTESSPDILINLLQDASTQDYSNCNKTVLLNSVIIPLSEIKGNNNILRMNGWKGFIERRVWEVAGETNEVIEQLFTITGKQFIVVPDEPGFIAARVIAMIINEAYFALEENVSTKTEIDTAMKLGTNYPLGPFEWGKKIGMQNIGELLQKLSAADSRYLPAKLLKQEALLS